MNKRQSDKDQQILEGKIFAFLSYLCILCIIPLVFKKDNPFVLRHAKQGLVLFLGEVAAFIVTILLPWMVKPAVLLLGILSFIGLIATLQGRDAQLPIVSRLADSITL